ncbi:MAG: 16S rRNA (cytosine(1402)-N(4))-methyltransferase RsmH [Planctomycetaceae bacterium]
MSPAPSNPQSNQRRTVHVPVMLHEVLEHLALSPGLTVVDGTLGAGGHSSFILKQLEPDGILIGLDRDQSMIDRAAQVVQGTNVRLVQSSYRELGTVLDDLGLEKVDRVLLDLGLSSDQLADRQRGFGFQTSAPLDMRFDGSSGESAGELLNRASQQEITDLLVEFGEVNQADRIARQIIQQRNQGKMQTAADLKEAVEAAVGVRSRGSHPATQVFQALRIAVNEELEHLTHFLQTVLPERLRPGGLAAIISFHSLEDRLVKNAFREVTLWNTLTRKPVAPTPSEIRLNPRARSAKLRVAERLP